MALETKIARLTDRQALSIVGSLAGELSSADMPEEAGEQSAALEAALAERGERVELGAATDAGPDRAAAAARELLALMAEVPEVRPSLEEWLDDPPTQEAAAIPLILAAPIVITGCIALLQVVGHMSFERSEEGRWKVSYDPARRAPIDDVIAQLGKPLAKLAGGAGGQP